jgi:hypothetical protein
MPVEVIFSRLYKEIAISSDEADKIARGASMIGLAGSSTSLEIDDIVRLTNNGVLLALAKYGDDGIFKVLKHFERSIDNDSQRLRANSRRI